MHAQYALMTQRRWNLFKDAKRRKDYLRLIVLGWRDLSPELKESLARENPQFAFVLNIMSTFESEDLL